MLRRPIIVVAPLVAFMVSAGALFPAVGHAASVLARPGEPPSTRPPTHVSAVIGWVQPLDWPRLDHGHQMGLRLSFEPSSRASVFAEFMFGTLRGTEVLPASYPGGTPYRVRYESDFQSLGIGGRLHLARDAGVRPFVELGGQVRFAEDDPTPYWYSHADPTPGVETGGVSALVRVGITTARWNGLGLWLDAGCESVLRNPGDRSLLPVRLGLQFH